MRKTLQASLAAVAAAVVVGLISVVAAAQPALSPAAPPSRAEASPAAKPTTPPLYPLLPTVIYTRENAPKTPKLADLPLKDSVGQYGITWTFDKPVPVGQFINGDWYVVGPVAIKMIDPKPLFGDEVKDIVEKNVDVREYLFPGKCARNGSWLNPALPPPGGHEFFQCALDSRMASGQYYDPNLFVRLPIAMKPGDSLISTISRASSEITNFEGQHVDPLRVAAVLTCLAEPQPADAFRPSFGDSRNAKIFLARNLHRERLASLPRPAVNLKDVVPTSLDHYARMFQKPWVDIIVFGFAAPVENLPHYGQHIAEEVGEATMLLQMDYSPMDKERVLVGLTQVGIDLHGMARAGQSWGSWGGLHSGRKWPIVLAGIILDDPDMQAPTKKLPKLHFAEDDQTAFGPIKYRGKTFTTSWTGSKAIFMGHTPQQIKDTIEAEAEHWDAGWGLLDVYPPSEWPFKGEGNLRASEAYRRANCSPAWVGEALAARIMHVEKVWDHDPFFAYVDRWMTEDDAEAVRLLKELKFSDMSKTKWGDFGRQGFISGNGQLVRAAWNQYRNNLPPAPDGSKTPNAETTWK